MNDELSPSCIPAPTVLEMILLPIILKLYDVVVRLEGDETRAVVATFDHPGPEKYVFRGPAIELLVDIDAAGT
jgi:hypothetical protein